MNQQTWRAWNDLDGGVVFAPAQSHAKLIQQGLLPENAIAIHTIKTCTGEEAMTLHYQRMGYEPYKPTGESQPCPNRCGSSYYPEGYGGCPNCGHIR